MSKKIVVVGSSNTDMVIQSARIPIPGETILGGNFFMTPGGKGANQAVAVARMGGNTTFIAKIGTDLFGEESRLLYEKEGIDTKHILSDSEHPSGIALIMVDERGENCISVASGANAHLLPRDIDNVRHEIENASIILTQLETPIETIEHIAKIATQSNVKLVLNPAPARELSDNLLSQLYMITPNKTEAEMLSGVAVADWNSAREAADVIANKGVEIVVITLGAMGAMIKHRDTYHIIVAEKVTAVDTTAAGDTFNGALCVALVEGMGILDAVKFASKAAAISVTRMGAQSSIPTRSELDIIL